MRVRFLTRSRSSPSHTVPSDSSGTEPPVLDFHNDWAGKSISEVEAFALPRSISYERRQPNLFHPVIVDERGLWDGTCIIIERVIIWNEADLTKEIEYAEKSNRLRLPWEQVSSVYANLDISNMTREEFVDEEEGDMEDGCSTCTKKLSQGSSDEVVAMREAVLKAWEGSVMRDSSFILQGVSYGLTRALVSSNPFQEAVKWRSSLNLRQTVLENRLGELATWSSSVCALQSMNDKSSYATLLLLLLQPPVDLIVIFIIIMTILQSVPIP